MYDFSKKYNTHILTYINDEVVSETESEYIDVEVNLTKMNHMSYKPKPVKCSICSTEDIFLISL